MEVWLNYFLDLEVLTLATYIQIGIDTYANCFVGFHNTNPVQSRPLGGLINGVAYIRRGEGGGGVLISGIKNRFEIIHGNVVGKTF